MPNRPFLPLFRAARPGFLTLTLALTLQGCAVVAVADAAVTVAATAVKVTAKTVGAAVDLVVPDAKD